MEERVNNSVVAEIVFIELYTASDCISHDLLFAKLEFYGFDKYLVHYIYSF